MAFPENQTLARRAGQDVVLSLRVEGAARVAQIRVITSILFLAVSGYLGFLQGQLDWRAYVVPLSAYAGVSLLLLGVFRAERFELLHAFAGPFTDCTAVYSLQSLSMPLSPHPAGVAGWSLGLLVFVMLLSVLSLRRSAVAVSATHGVRGRGPIAAYGRGSHGSIPFTERPVGRTRTGCPTQGPASLCPRRRGPRFRNVRYASYQLTHAEPCASPVQRLTDIWNAKVQEEIQRAFESSATAHAHDTWVATRQMLDNYSRDWTIAATTVCEALKNNPGATASLFGSRCLDGRRSELCLDTRELR
jgi:hypothetical protein